MEQTYTTNYAQGGVIVTNQTRRPCPYHVEVEKRAWCEGYMAARNYADKGGDATNDSATDVPMNPYTSGDTSTAWTTGYKDFSYDPAPFNPLDPFEGMVDVPEHIKRDRIRNEVYVVQGAETWDKKVYLAFEWSSYGQEEHKPAWANNRVEDRSIELKYSDFQTVIKRGIWQMPDQSIELPCPPYTYEYEDGGMTISSGKFRKWGEKDDWQRVVEEMVEKVEEMPDGIRVDEAYVTVDCTVAVRTSFTVPIDSIVSTENGYWYESKEALQEAIESGIMYVGSDAHEYLDFQDVDFDYADVSDLEGADIWSEIGDL